MKVIRCQNINKYSFNVTKQELTINHSYSTEFIELLLKEIDLMGFGEKERGTTYKQYIER